MALDKDQISQKLAQLEEYVSQIKKYGQKPESEFTADSMVEAAAERGIYKAAQQVIDIAQSISSDLGFGPPRFYRNLFVQLGQHGVISQELQPKLEAVAGLRNKLAHEYAVIKPKEIYQVAKQDYQDLIEFAKQISSHLRNLTP
jgi:uncharacterized protein YutE (UPF0331/DUF86 family)